jgi:hypothetical protein
MANFVNITLDTTSPTGLVISLDNGATFTSDDYVDVSISIDDMNRFGYQLKIWGDVDLANDVNVQDREDTSSWITFAETYQVKLSAIEGTKTVYAKVRDDVFNESVIVSDSITKDTEMPVVTVTNPDVSKISKRGGRNVATFSFTADSTFVEYQVRVVNSTGAGVTTGAIIPTTNGSVNTSGTGTFDTSTSPITVSITGGDLELASAGDGTKIVKVFVRDEAGNFSA